MSTESTILIILHIINIGTNLVTIFIFLWFIYRHDQYANLVSQYHGMLTRAFEVLDLVSKSLATLNSTVNGIVDYNSFKSNLEEAIRKLSVSKGGVSIFDSDVNVNRDIIGHDKDVSGDDITGKDIRTERGRK
jgi:hypothetical protein